MSLRRLIVGVLSCCTLAGLAAIDVSADDDLASLLIEAAPPLGWVEGGTPDEVGLLPEPFREWAYGVSLRLPAHARPVVDVNEAVVGPWMLGPERRGRLVLRALPSPDVSRRLDLKRLHADAMTRINAAVRSESEPELLQWGETATGRLGVVTVLRFTRYDSWRDLRADQGEPRWLAFALVELEDGLLLELTLELPDETGVGVGRPLLSALLQSLDHTPADELDRQRQDLLRWTQLARDAVSPDDLEQAWAEPRWFAMVEGDRTVGWFHAALDRSAAEHPAGTEGLRLVTHGQWRARGVRGSVRNVLWRELADRREVWSRVTTIRRPDADPSDPGAKQSWSETGLRGMRNGLDRVTVSREGAPPPNVMAYALARADRGRHTILERTGADYHTVAGRQVDDFAADRRLPDPTPQGAAPAGNVSAQAWTTPPRGYLPQLELWTLMEHLPRRRDAAFAFYAFDPVLARVVLHRGWLTPLPGGGAALRLQASPMAPPTFIELDRDGRIARTTLLGGRSLERVTLDELRRRLGQAGLEAPAG